MPNRRKQIVPTKMKEIISKTKNWGRAKLDLAYEFKKISAVERIEQLRAENTQAAPKDIQKFLEEALRNAEAQFGFTSENYATERSLFVVACIELRQVAATSEMKNHKFVDRALMLDSQVMKIVRSVPIAVASIMEFVPQAKIGKQLQSSKRLSPDQVRKITTALKNAKKIADKAAAAQGMVQKVGDKILRSDKLIFKTQTQLGPVPTNWPSEISTSNPDEGVA
jgi:hypothetical protein